MSAQLALFDALNTPPVQPPTVTRMIPWSEFQTVEIEPVDRSWPSNIMLHHPDNLHHPCGHGPMSWTGRGRMPPWVIEWAKSAGLSVISQDTARRALAVANGITVPTGGAS